MNIVPELSSGMEEDPPATINDHLGLCTKTQDLFGLNEPIDLMDDKQSQTLVYKLSCLLGWCPDTKPDPELLVKLYHIGVKLLR